LDNVGPTRGGRIRFKRHSGASRGLTLDIACVPVLFPAIGQETIQEGMMKTLITATLLSFVIGTATAFAQAPAAPATPPVKPKMTSEEKKAISKACSDQANAKGLHGKDRQKFRAACIKGGGKTQ
jgi:hypothetical protein